MTRNRSCSIGIAATTLVASVTHGAETSWINPGNAAWSSPESWSAGVPGLADTAVFSLVGPQRIIDLGAAPLSMDRLRISKGMVRFNGNASLEALGMNAFAASMMVGSSSLSTTTARWNSQGTLRAGRLDIATGNQTLAELTIATGALEVVHDARIGVVGDGSLFLARASQFEWLELGSTSSGYGVVAGNSFLNAAAPITVDSQCTIGKFGEGLMVASSGSFGSLMLGQNAGSNGNLTLGDAAVGGTLTIGHGGTGTLRTSGSVTCTGTVVLAAQGNPIFPPYVPNSHGTLELNGGQVHCGGEFTVGLGVAEVSVTGDGSIESMNAIRAGAQSVFRCVVPSSGSDVPILTAPTVSLGAASWFVQVDGTPAPEATWILVRSWSTTSLTIPTIIGNPGSGREWRTVQCGGDLYLATAVPGEPDPDVCVEAEPLVDIPDPDAGEERSFGAGGVAIGNGWFAVGCPGASGSIDIFRRAGVTWIREARLTAPSGAIIGQGVAADGQRLATYADSGTSVITFVRDRGQWMLEQVIPLNAAPTGLSLRNAIALEGDLLAIGVPDAPLDALSSVGRVDIFRLGAQGWGRTASVLPEGGTQLARFGQHLAVDGERVAASQSGSSNQQIAIIEEGASGWGIQSSVAGNPVTSGQTICLEAGVLICNVSYPSATTSFWRPIDGVWREVASVPSYSLPASAPERTLLVRSSSLRFLEPTPEGLWRLGASMTVPGTPMSLVTAGALTVLGYSDRVAIIDHVRPTPCPADFNGDGLVDGGDLGFILSTWDSNAGGDLTGDGVTDGSDLGVLLSAWGPCAP
jgi:hypothetical protein